MRGLLVAGISAGGFLCLLPALPAARDGIGDGVEGTGGPITAMSDEIAIGGEDWRLVHESKGPLKGVTTNARGDLFFNDLTESKTYLLSPGSGVKVPESFLEESGGAEGQAFGTDGRLYAAATGERKVVAYTGDHLMEVIAEDIQGGDLTVTHGGRIYVLEPAQRTGKHGRIWLIQPGHPPIDAGSGPARGGRMALLPDQETLLISDPASGWIRMALIQRNGLLGEVRDFCKFEDPAAASDSGADFGLRVTRNGLILVGCKAGIRVFDGRGKAVATLSVPGGPVNQIAFGGVHFDELYAACGGKLYSRKVRVQGAQAFQPPAGGAIRR